MEKRRTKGKIYVYVRYNTLVLLKKFVKDCKTFPVYDFTQIIDSSIKIAYTLDYISKFKKEMLFAETIINTHDYQPKLFTEVYVFHKVIFYSYRLLTERCSQKILSSPSMSKDTK